MDDFQRFSLLMSGLRAGESWAADELCRVYGPFLRAAVRRQLHPELRSRFDSLDFVQDLWVSFLAIPRDQYTFESPNTLRQFLTQIVLNKVVDVYRQRFGSQKHDMHREVPLAEETSGIEPPSSAPTPSQLAVATEEWERILNRFPAGHRAVLIRLREGHGYEDIARITGISHRTITRIVRRLKEIAGF